MHGISRLNCEISGNHNDKRLEKPYSRYSAKCGTHFGAGGGVAVSSLTKASSDPDKGVCYASMSALHSIGSVEAINALNEMVSAIEDDLVNPDIQLRETAVELLKSIGTDEAKTALNRHKHKPCCCKRTTRTRRP